MKNAKQIEIPCLGYSVVADWYEGGGDNVLLVLVGYTSSKASYVDLVSHIVETTGTSALVLDYSGHGESPFELKDVCPAQNFLEVVKAFDWLKKQYPDKKINVMGTSYGGFMAVQLIKYREFENLILRVPAIYRPDEFYTTWAWRLDHEEEYVQQEQQFRKNKEALANHPLLARATNFKGKTLVVVHEFDEFVPKETTDTYIKAFNADTYLAKGFPHRFKDEAPMGDKMAYKNAISDWLNKTTS
jgi:uncharacterized protein